MDLLDDMKLKSILDQLTGIAAGKPFDCVGTVKEVNLALCETIRQARQKDLPALLNYYRSQPVYQHYRNVDFHAALVPLDLNHHVPETFFHLIKSVLHE